MLEKPPKPPEIKEAISQALKAKGGNESGKSDR